MTFSSSPDLAFHAEANPRKIQHSSRFLFYSHDGLGLGHLRRNLSVATALAELAPKASILVATSAEEAQRFPIPPTVDILKLPGLRKVDNGHYAPRRLNVPWRDVRSVRASLLLAAVNSFRPTVVLVDKHPLGVGGELEPALERTRAAGAGAVLGFRDVLDDPAAVHAEMRERGLFAQIARYYDRVLVYGQPDILDARREYGFPEEVAAMTRFCGYVVAAETARGNGPTAGTGRATGRTSSPRPAEARTASPSSPPSSRPRPAPAGTPASCPARIATRATSRRLGDLADRAGVDFRRFVPDLSSEFPTLDALVCMGGYNTLTEAAASGVSTVCVPRVRPRSEQLIRAQAFARRGLLTVVEPGDLDPAVLEAEVESALTRQAHGAEDPAELDLGGARRAAGHLLELASETARDVRWPEGISVG